MHEFSIATSLLEQLLRIGAEQRATRVVQVELRCGVTRQIVPEALELAFAAVSADTLAAGATLHVVTEPLRAACRSCQREFAAAIDDYRCPACGRADVVLVGGHDIVLQTVVCETAEAPMP